MPNTPFGFTWGPMEVLRACSDKRFRAVLIRTPYAEVEDLRAAVVRLRASEPNTPAP